MYIYIKHKTKYMIILKSYSISFDGVVTVLDVYTEVHNIIYCTISKTDGDYYIKKIARLN